MLTLLLACVNAPDDAVEAPDPATPTQTEDVEQEYDGPSNVDRDGGGDALGGGLSDDKSLGNAPYAEHEGDSDTQTWCRTLVNHRGAVALIVVDMDTGDWTEEAYWTGFDPEGTYTGGLATDGTTWVFAADEHDRGSNWYAVDAATGTVTLLGPAAGGQYGVGWTGTEWVAADPHRLYLERYASPADLAAGDATASAPIEDHDVRFTRFAVVGDEVWGAWHSTRTVIIYDLATGEFDRLLSVAEWDTWVWGMSVAGDKLHLIDHGNLAEGFYTIGTFDTGTGDALETVRLGNMPGRPTGLWCTTAP